MEKKHYKENLFSNNKHKKSEAIQNMFASIATHYDSFNHLMSFGKHHEWRKIAVEKLYLNPTDSVLDLCTGSGDFIKPLSEKICSTGSITAVDYCKPLLDICRKKYQQENINIIESDALNLPFNDHSFDAVTIGWGLRNLTDLDKGISEISRVLKKNGKFVSIDMSTPHNKIYKFISHKILSWLIPAIWKIVNNSDAGYYLFKSTEKFADIHQLCDRLNSVSIRSIKTKSFMFGNISIIWGIKH